MTLMYDRSTFYNINTKIVKYMCVELYTGPVSSCDGLIHSSTYVSVVWFIKLYTVFDSNKKNVFFVKII